MSSFINVSGISSGIQWGDIVDSTVKALEARTVTPVTDEITKRTAQKEAWKSFQSLVETLNSSARAVRLSGFGGFTANAPASQLTSRTLFTASASEAATAGKYRVEVVQLAETAKVAGARVADVGAAAGLTGTFDVNGRTVTVAASDSLRVIQRKINDLNTGTNATGVSATIVSEGGTAGRLVLAGGSAGDGKLTLTDGTNGLGRSLGLVDTRSKPISSAVQSVAAAMGMSVTPQPAQIRIGDTVITADLALESISSIAAKINAAGGAASVEPEVYGDETRYRLVVDGNVSAVEGDDGSQDVIDALGFTAGGAGTVRQTVQSAALTEGEDPATAGTLLTALGVGGTGSNLAVGDAIQVKGTRGDGTSVTVGIVIKADDTLQSLLDRMNDVASGFKSGSRTATAGLGPDGRIRLTDDTGGVSRLAFSMSYTRADGTTGTLGSTAVSVQGRSRELQAGRDAIVRVDGREVRGTSNTLTTAIPGVTLGLQNAEPGTGIDVTVDRNLQGGVDAVQKFADAYNAIRNFFDQQREAESPLYANSSLRRVVGSFTDALRTKVADNTTYKTLSVTGLVLDRNGVLTVDSAKVRKALLEQPAEVESLFGFTGVGTAFVTATDNATRFGDGTIYSQVKSIDNATVKLKARETSAQAKLEQKREQLVAQYTRMEESLNRLKAQGSGITSMLAALQQGNN